MSGGFFRGTSAEQDTRFSNKQAKLLKSQKFAPELEHLVDMTKVKMDVMRPWIANRVTELIGFEDEVLINFIYGLLDGKVVNGKEVQISLTGFMERNTGKFMKELWALLLSAQTNASGVPQQFLDAKAEETKKKKAESDRIVNEIQRKREKESRELEQERNKSMDAGGDMLKDIEAHVDPISKYQHRDSDVRSAEEKEPKERNGSRGRIRVSKSPHSADRSSSPRGMRSRSNSKSFSNSRSYSDGRPRSRSLSTTPKRRGRSSSSEMVRRFPPKRSLTPHRRRSPRRSLTPPRRRSSYSRRSRNRSPSPSRYRMRSPLGRRSRSPPRRRSRSPIWRRSRSPIRRSPWNRSRSPRQPRSPSLRRKSQSPIRRRSPSPMRRRHRRSPTPQHRSRSPVRRRSRSSIRRRSPVPGRRRSPTPADHRSHSGQYWSSPSPVRRRTPSPIRMRSPRRQRRTPVRSPGQSKRNREYHSPLRRASPGTSGELPVDAHKRSMERRSRSDSWDRNDSRRKIKESSPSPRRSLVSEGERETSPGEERRLNGSSGNPLDKNRGKRIRSYSPSPPRKATENKFRPDSSETSGDDKDTNYTSGNKYGKMDNLKKPDLQKSQVTKNVLLSEQKRELPNIEKNQSRLNDIKTTDQRVEALPKLSKKVKQSDESGSGSEESDKIRAKVREKRNNKRSERRGLDSDDESSYDSYEEERKEAKRRRKEEKKLRKEERRRRREERRRKREARRAEKLKLKSADNVSTPSDTEKYHDDHSEEEKHARRHKSRGNDNEEKESEQKRLEIELREKALESLRAKKGIGH